MSGSGTRRLGGLFAVALIASALTLSCGDDGAAPANDPSARLRQAQTAIDKSGGYALNVEQTNFILPHWGGSDGGTVTVEGQGEAASARLQRTGEPDATYLIVLLNGITYFTRSTCPSSFRVPGGTAEVLQPFLFTKTQSFAKASSPSATGGTITATMGDLGPVEVTLDPKTNRPVRITGRTGNGPFTWTFASWGKQPPAVKPSGEILDRGPGGVPC